MKHLAHITCALTLLASMLFAVGEVFVPSAAAVIPTALLGYGIVAERERARWVGYLVVMILLVGLGLVWPSLFTLLAVLVLPAIPLAVRHLVTGQTGAKVTNYVRFSAALAGAALLFEAAWLARALA